MENTELKKAMEVVNSAKGQLPTMKKQAKSLEKQIEAQVKKETKQFAKDRLKQLLEENAELKEIKQMIATIDGGKRPKSLKNKSDKKEQEGRAEGNQTEE